MTLQWHCLAFVLARYIDIQRRNLGKICMTLVVSVCLSKYNKRRAIESTEKLLRKGGKSKPPFFCGLSVNRVRVMSYLPECHTEWTHCDI